jgi:hypothetical protein
VQWAPAAMTCQSRIFKLIHPNDRVVAIYDEETCGTYVLFQIRPRESACSRSSSPSSYTGPAPTFARAAELVVLTFVNASSD